MNSVFVNMQQHVVYVTASEAGYSARRLLSMHPEHLWSDSVHPSGVGCRSGWVAGVFHHRTHVLPLCT